MGLPRHTRDSHPTHVDEVLRSMIKDANPEQNIFIHLKIPIYFLKFKIQMQQIPFICIQVWFVSFYQIILLDETRNFALFFEFLKKAYSETFPTFIKRTANLHLYCCFYDQRPGYAN